MFFSVTKRNLEGIAELQVNAFHKKEKIKDRLKKLN